MKVTSEKIDHLPSISSNSETIYRRVVRNTASFPQVLSKNLLFDDFRARAANGDDDDDDDEQSLVEQSRVE